MIRRFLCALQYALFLAGSAGIGVYADSLAERWIYQLYGGYELDAATRNQATTMEGFAGYLYDRAMGRAGDLRVERKVALRPAEAPPQNTQPRLLKAKHADGPIASIEIPRVNVSALVREGVDDSTLRLAAGHVPGTAFPGETGNVAIAAHRDTFFRGLREIRKNDLITVRTPEGDYEYQVKSYEIVRPTDVQVLEAHGKRELTLITCYPFTFIGHAPSRYIVHAEAVGDNDSEPVFGPAGATP